MTEARKMARAKLVLLGRENCGKTGKSKSLHGGTYGLLIMNCSTINNISSSSFFLSLSLYFSCCCCVSLTLLLFKIQLCVWDSSPSASLGSMTIKRVTHTNTHTHTDSHSHWTVFSIFWPSCLVYILIFPLRGDLQVLQNSGQGSDGLGDFRHG